jgi:hypothetical protein
MGVLFWCNILYWRIKYVHVYSPREYCISQVTNRVAFWPIDMLLIKTCMPFDQNFLFSFFAYSSQPQFFSYQVLILFCQSVEYKYSNPEVRIDKWQTQFKNWRAPNLLSSQSCQMVKEKTIKFDPLLKLALLRSVARSTCLAGTAVRKLFLRCERRYLLPNFNTCSHAHA